LTHTELTHLLEKLYHFHGGVAGPPTSYQYTSCTVHVFCNTYTCTHNSTYEQECQIPALRGPRFRFDSS